MDKIDRILTRGVANIIPNKEELKKLLSQNKKLNIYLGIDPTATRIHLGHAVPLIKLQEFAELGNNVIFLIGDFTALVGDTSDKDSERPILTKEEIEENFKTYKKQAEKVLVFSKVEVRHNSEWLSKLGFGDVLNLVRKFSLNDFISRELIKKRLGGGGHIRLDEVLYPVMQGYDSYFMNTDLQVGGTDQTFNMQAGRTLQKLLRNKESFILATEFLMGTDGRKMSKSWGNAIWLDDDPRDMFAKVMAINDGLIIQYFTLVTRVSSEEIEEFKHRLKVGENPMSLKKELAHEIVTELHGKNAADEAATHFENIFQKQEMATVDIPVYLYQNSEPITIVDLLMNANLATSRSEAKRLVEQGGVEVDGAVVESPAEEVTPENGMLIRAGKKQFVRIQTEK